MQHPLGVAFHYGSSQLYITDTFNNKLKRVDMKSFICSIYEVNDADTKKQRAENSLGKFNEPCGLAILDHRIFIADKNNSHIKQIDLNHGTVVRVGMFISRQTNNRQLSSSVDLI